MNDVKKQIPLVVIVPEVYALAEMIDKRKTLDKIEEELDTIQSDVVPVDMVNISQDLADNIWFGAILSHNDQDTNRLLSMFSITEVLESSIFNRRNLILFGRDNKTIAWVNLSFAKKIDDYLEGDISAAITDIKEAKKDSLKLVVDEIRQQGFVVSAMKDEGGIVIFAEFTRKEVDIIRKYGALLMGTGCQNNDKCLGMATIIGQYTSLFLDEVTAEEDIPLLKKVFAIEED